MDCPYSCCFQAVAASWNIRASELEETSRGRCMLARENARAGIRAQADFAVGGQR